MAAAELPGQRLDKWLWYARVTKSRTIASIYIARGRIRVNRVRIEKPSFTVRPGDVVTASVPSGIRVLKVLDPGRRRGPAKEAELLYEDLTPAEAPGAGRRVLSRPPRFQKEGGQEQQERNGAAVVPNSDPAGEMGRPNKKERRQLRRVKGAKGE